MGKFLDNVVCEVSLDRRQGEAALCVAKYCSCLIHIAMLLFVVAKVTNVWLIFSWVADSAYLSRLPGFWHHWSVQLVPPTSYIGHVTAGF